MNDPPTAPPPSSGPSEQTWEDKVSTAGAAPVSGTANGGEAGQKALEIVISHDKMAATLSIKPEALNVPVTPQEILEQTKDLGIDPQFIDREALSRVCDSQQADAVLIAAGIDAVDGVNTLFERLIEIRENHGPTEDELGNVNHKDLSDFLLVEKGTPLLRRVPATAGKGGADLLGRPISATNGIDRKLDSSGDGVAVSDDDDNVLVAAIQGHPVFSEYSVKVEPVLTLDAVNLRTGDVTFDGSVLVKGDVAPGYSINATGNITVCGMVERAQLKAGHSIVVQGGVIGTEAGDEDSDAASLHAVLFAEDSIEARFLSMCSATAGNRLTVTDSVVQSELKAGEELRIGVSGGKGTVVGGHCEAGQTLTVAVAGSSANVATALTVGKGNSYAQQLEELKLEFEDKMDQMLKLSSMHKQLKGSARPGADSDQHREKLRKIANTVNQLRETVDGITDQMTELSTLMKRANEACILVKKELFANVSLTINNGSKTLRESCGAGVFVSKGTKLQFCED
jgi:uncharacterized protein (DUF342 family)